MAASAGLLLALGCGRRASTPKQEALHFKGAPAVVMAAGDIACDPRDPHYNNGRGAAGHCQMYATSEAISSAHPDAVLALGDEQYEDGRLDAFRQSYDASWGRFRDSTHPVPGNHEDRVRSGYYQYFGKVAGDPAKGYYSFDQGKWHIIALNSNCDEVGCGAGSEQEKWLKQDLAAHAGQCTLAYWHIPRFSSGFHGDTAESHVFWIDLYAAGADIVLNGHDHDYERFAPQTPFGRRDDPKGIREFVVGTGGKNLRSFIRHAPWHSNSNSVVRQSTEFGVLKLELYPTGYTWEFVSTEKPPHFTDSGAATCHALQAENATAQP